MANYLAGADRDKLDTILDGCVAAYLHTLDEDGQVAFKGSAKAFTRTYSFLSSVLPFSSPEWEKLSIFLNFLIPKLPAPRDEDLSKGKRELDPEPWTIAEYDWKSGEHVLKRGIVAAKFVDQFDIEQSEKADPKKRDLNGSAFVRDPNVRNKVKQRSKGLCEFCGKIGFTMPSGAIYLETHHVVPLSEGGPDDEWNVVALCPLDHRMAHYSHDHAHRRKVLLEYLDRARGA